MDDGNEQMSTIGRRLRCSRERRVLTQQELAASSGVRKVTISRIENERVAKRPRPSTIRKLAAALRVDPAWLLAGDGDEEAGKGNAS